jgi:hypothetical protein
MFSGKFLGRKICGACPVPKKFITQEQLTDGTFIKTKTTAQSSKETIMKMIITNGKVHFFCGHGKDKRTIIVNSGTYEVELIEEHGQEKYVLTEPEKVGPAGGKGKEIYLPKIIVYASKHITVTDS